MSTYDESVYASRWFIAVLVVAAAGSLFSAVDALRDDGGNRVLGAGLPALIAALLIAIAVVFGRLRTEAGRNGLRFHFGPFGRTLEAADIRAAEVVPYRWLRFGGWGIRRGRMAGHSVHAYSVPFLRTGVAVQTRDGTRYYVSSRRPDVLAAAINQATRPREGQA